MKKRNHFHAIGPFTHPKRPGNPRRGRPGLLVGTAMAGLGLMTLAGNLHAQAVSLGAAENFTIVSGQGVTNNGLTIIAGNVALSPLTTISGFEFSTPPGAGVVIGTVHYNDGLAAQAQADSLTAYNTLAGKPYLPANDLTGLDLGGMTLAPGTYHFNTSAGLTGNMILNTQADPNAVFIFQIGSSLTTAVGSSVVVIGAGAGSDPNVFWQVGSSATLNTGTSFTGNILALASVSMGTGASLANGRAIALNGAVTLLGNSVSAPGLLAVPQGRFWNGSANKLWSSANWSSTAAGTDQLNLASNADVVFSINSGARNQTTILDSNTSISSLTFNDSVAVTVGGTKTLTLTAAGFNRGINVDSGAGLATIGSKLVLGNLSQVVTVNNSAGMLISGVIGGSNGLTKAGTGVLTLTGTEKYTGTTTVAGGTLQIGDGSAFKSSIQSSEPVRITNLAGRTSVLAINLRNHEWFYNDVSNNGQIRWIAAGSNAQSANSVFGGDGSMKITATGKTILLGKNTFSGGTTINTTGTVRVGHITGNLTTAFGSGVLNLKNGYVDTDRSTVLGINVGGYVQSGGEIGLHLAGTAPASYTRYNVAGTAKLSGGTVFVYDATGNYVPQGGDKQNILHTTGGLSGQFASDSPHSKFYNSELDRNILYHRGDTLLYPTVTYKAKDAYIKWVQGSFKSIDGLTPNQDAVGGGLDGYVNDNPGDPDGLVTFLNQQNPADLADMYDLIAPDELTAIFQMGFSAAEIQNNNIERHLEQVRQGPVAASPVQYTPSAKGSKGGMVEQTSMAPETNRWSVFLEGTGGSASVDGSGNANGYDFDTMGMTLGADLRVNDHLVVGILGSYANSDASLVNHGSIDAESYKGAVYASAFADGFYVDALLGAGYNTYDTKRASLLGYADASPDGWELDSLINAGYDFHQGNWTFSPTASVAYTQVNLNHFTETGSLTPLDYPDQNQNSLRTDLGLNISYTAMISGIKVTPQMRVSWQHEFLDSTQSMDSRFAAGNGPLFTVAGPHMDRDRALIGAGVNVQITPTVAIYGYYDGQLGSSNYTSNTVSAGVKIDF